MRLRRFLLIFGRGIDKFQIIMIAALTKIGHNILTRYVSGKACPRSFESLPQRIIELPGKPSNDFIIIKRNSNLRTILCVSNIIEFLILTAKA